MARATVIKKSDSGAKEFDIEIEADPLPPPGAQVGIGDAMYTVESWLYIARNDQAKVVRFDLIIYVK